MKHVLNGYYGTGRCEELLNWFLDFIFMWTLEPFHVYTFIVPKILFSSLFRVYDSYNTNKSYSTSEKEKRNYTCKNLFFNFISIQ